MRDAEVSIHAPAWGATVTPCNQLDPSYCFNPRTRVGCDGNRCAVARPSRCFNPRTRVGCDTCAAVSVGWLAGFNPRTRVGCDQPRLTSSTIRRSFNPRTRVGCDNPFVRDKSGRLMFQSTHPRGVRRRDMRFIICESNVSIHAPAWGATSLTIDNRIVLNGFNPRTRVGCDMIPLNNATETQMFQSTHPRGVRQDSTGNAAEGLTVSIHAPAWGATVSMFYPVDSRD